MTNETTDRRTLLAAGATVATIGVAGCIGLEGADGGATPTDASSGSANGATPSPDGEATSTPATGPNDLRAITWGQSREGVIDEDDPRDPAQNELAEPVTFEGRADQVARITMRSDPLDPYLVLTDPSGDVIAQNDDGAGMGFDSRMEPVLPTDGTYTIWAGAWGIDETGRYTLSLEAGTAPANANLRSIAFGETRDGYVDDQDGTDPKYDYTAEPVTFDADAGTDVRITMRSDVFDPLLLLADPSGAVVAENDDAAGGFHSRIDRTLEASGTYTIYATSWSGRATGAYRLTLETG